jgi:uncharacterized membrane protein YgcG
MATRPDLRIGDADREAAAASLREHYAQGRLTLEEFNQRLDAAFAAITQSQLHRVTGDLPLVAPPSPPLPVARAGDYRERARDEHRHGPRPRPRVLAAFVTVIVAFVLVASLLLPELRGFPLPGRLGILLAVFAVIRGLMRRIMGGGRRGGRCGYSRGGHHTGWGSTGGGPWQGGR